jgi:hypothetical protein
MRCYFSLIVKKLFIFNKKKQQQQQNKQNPIKIFLFMHAKWDKVD